jgi:hypothetical protein
MNTYISGLKVIGAALLLAALAACGSGLDSSAGTSSSSSSSGGGSNNTPPGIPNSIVFAPPASTNTVIALQGTGGKTNAQVTFQVNDASNTGVGGVPVTFSLIPTTGDATLTTATGTTAANGQVSTFVVSGNEHYSVTVLATVSTPSGVKTAPSNSLTITTGIPTEGNFAMAVTNLTANNANDTLGITDTVTVQLSDRFSNPAPDGTAVAFYANSGQIPGECLTVGGSCTVTWVSSGLPNAADGLHLPGRAEILAYTVGEESFDDVDGDGVFDNNDVFTTFQSGTTVDSFIEPNYPAVDDIGEVYLDGAERGLNNLTAFPTPYISGDFFHDFNGDNKRNLPDGKFYGFGCKGTATVSCGSGTTKEIGKQICINMSTSGANILVSAGGTATLTGNALSVGAGPATLSFQVSDRNGHALASGTSVALLQSGVVNVVVNSPTNLPYSYADVGCGNNAQTFTLTITLSPPAVPPVTTAGTLELKVVTPGPGGAETDSAVITLGP